MDWNRRYLENDTPWERGEPAPPLVEYLQSHKIAGRVLVPGCGTGHEARLIAAQGCETVGIDISEAALRRAADFPFPPGAKLDFRLHDILEPTNDLPNESFDWVFEHTCFCAIDPARRVDYVNSVARVLKCGGQLLAILFTDLEEETDGPPYSISHDKIESLFSARFDIIRFWRPTRVFSGREGEETMFLMRKR